MFRPNPAAENEAPISRSIGSPGSLYCRKRKQLWCRATVGDPDARFPLSSAGRGLRRADHSYKKHNPMSTKKIINFGSHVSVAKHNRFSSMLNDMENWHFISPMTLPNWLQPHARRRRSKRSLWRLGSTQAYCTCLKAIHPCCAFSIIRSTMYSAYTQQFIYHTK